MTPSANQPIAQPFHESANESASHPPIVPNFLSIRLDSGLVGETVGHISPKSHTRRGSTRTPFLQPAPVSRTKDGRANYRRIIRGSSTHVYLLQLKLQKRNKKSKGSSRVRRHVSRSIPFAVSPLVRRGALLSHPSPLLPVIGAKPSGG